MTEVVLFTPAIGRLPTEILQEIFLFASSADSLNPPKPPQLPTRWIISHVCRYWYDVVSHCPRLWSFISFSPTTLPGPRRLAQQAFQRSQGVDLDISMIWSATAGNWAGRREKGHFITLALSRRSLWRGLAITDNEFGVESNLAVLAEGVRHTTLPTLRKVQYHTTRNGREGHHVFELISSAPNLEFLNLRNVDFMGCRVPSSLRVLRLDNCNLRTLGALYTMLDLVSSLEVLHMADTLPYSEMHEHPSHPSSRPIQLPKLHTLSLALRSYAHDALFLRQLHAPRVSTLHLWSGRNPCPLCPPQSAALARAEAAYMDVYRAVDEHDWPVETVDVAELGCPSLPLLECLPTLRRLAVARTSDLRAFLYTAMLPKDEKSPKESRVPIFRLDALAIHDLDEPSFLLSALQSPWPTPLATLTRIYAPRAVALPWNLSVLSPNVGVVREGHAHERLHREWPVEERWPDWAAPGFSEGGPARRRG